MHLHFFVLGVNADTVILVEVLLSYYKIEKLTPSEGETRLIIEVILPRVNLSICWDEIPSTEELLAKDSKIVGMGERGRVSPKDEEADFGD